MSQDGKAYLANASHPDFGDAEVAGKLYALDYLLKFECEAGTVDLLYDDMVITFGTKQDPRVTFTSERQPGCVFTASNADITREVPFRCQGHLHRQIEEHRAQVEGRQRLVLTALFCTVFVGLSALLGAAVEWMLPRLIDRVPVTWEKELGKKVAAEVRKEFKISAETNAAAQLNTLVAQLAKSLPKHEYEFQVTLLADPEPNAFALPGGQIFVNLGLLRLCTNSVEVAGVLAHEISHVTKRHGLRTLITTIGPSRAMQAVFGNNHGFLSALAAGSDLLVGQSFSREFEREADDGGFALMLAANLDPRGLENGLKRLQSLGGSNGPRAFMSHPPTPERIERLATQWTSASRKTGFATIEPFKLPPPKAGENIFDKLDRLLDK